MRALGPPGRAAFMGWTPGGPDENLLTILAQLAESQAPWEDLHPLVEQPEPRCSGLQEARTDLKCGS